MKIESSYSDIYKAALSTRRFSVGHLYHIKMPTNIDTIGCYKIFYFVSGHKKFHIDDQVYDVNPGDLFLVNQRESHYFSHVDVEESQERMVFFIYPEFLKSVCTEQTDLTACFHGDSCYRHKLTLQEKERTKVLNYIERFSAENELGQDVLDYSTFLELMVFVNRIAHSRQQSGESATVMYSTQPRQIREILAYINLHITEDISLEEIAEQFYISTSYLCRIFKSGTGTTIHKYITAGRITRAKDLLSEGYSCLDASSLSGFKDYNGFWKSFVKQVGVSPAKYAQFNLGK